MKKSKFQPLITVIIPARMASSRFPGKPLVPILGLPMVEHVRRRALLAEGVNQVVVATCDEPIKSAVEQFGGLAVMTRDTHERCTDRVEEAMQSLPGGIVVMVQGDEPLLVPESISQVLKPLLEDPSLEVVNLISHLESKEDYYNPNIVKAVCDLKGNIIFFTRSAVPYFRKEVQVPVFRQTGIMAFRTAFLKRYSTLTETSLEIAESVDMLRVIEHGVRISGVITNCSTYGVDLPEDVQVVESIIKTDPEQNKLFQLISSFDVK